MKRKIILLTMDPRTERRLRRERKRDQTNKLVNKKEQQRLYKISVENEIKLLKWKNHRKQEKALIVKKQLRDVIAMIDKLQNGRSIASRWTVYKNTVNILNNSIKTLR
tara:strand:+ start:953 stop:1276 length:324 start_codon:yes stop_codon:yes gene_type:complete